MCQYFANPAIMEGTHLPCLAYQQQQQQQQLQRQQNHCQSFFTTLIYWQSILRAAKHGRSGLSLHSKPVLYQKIVSNFDFLLKG